MKNTRGKKVIAMAIVTFAVTLINSRDVNANVPEVIQERQDQQVVRISEPKTINKVCTRDLNPLNHKSTMALMLSGEEVVEDDSEEVEEKSYTEAEVSLLATVIHAEAGICDDHEKFMVGTVVLNRVDSYIFPNTLNEVVYQDGQFTSVNGKAWSETPTEREEEIAIQLLEGYRECPSNVLFFSKKCDFGYQYEKTKWHEYGALD